MLTHYFGRTVGRCSPFAFPVLRQQTPLQIAEQIVNATRSSSQFFALPLLRPATYCSAHTLPHSYRVQCNSAAQTRTALPTHHAPVYTKERHAHFQTNPQSLLTNCINLDAFKNLCSLRATPKRNSSNDAAEQMNHSYGHTL